jgi:hypothetical protein
LNVPLPLNLRQYARRRAGLHLEEMQFTATGFFVESNIIGPVTGRDGRCFQQAGGEPPESSFGPCAICEQISSVIVEKQTFAYLLSQDMP